MIRRPPRSTLSSSSAASDVYKRQFTSCIFSRPMPSVYDVSVRPFVCPCVAQYSSRKELVTESSQLVRICYFEIETKGQSHEVSILRSRSCRGYILIIIMIILLCLWTALRTISRSKDVDFYEQQLWHQPCDAINGLCRIPSIIDCVPGVARCAAGGPDLKRTEAAASSYAIFASPDDNLLLI